MPTRIVPHASQRNPYHEPWSLLDAIDQQEFAVADPATLETFLDLVANRPRSTERDALIVAGYQRFGYSLRWALRAVDDRLLRSLEHAAAL